MGKYLLSIILALIILGSDVMGQNNESNYLNDFAKYDEVEAQSGGYLQRFYQYDSKGYLIKEVRMNGDDKEWVITYENDDNGNKIKSKLYLNEHLLKTYSYIYGVSKKETEISVYNEIGKRVIVYFYDKKGNLIFEFPYDAQGKVNKWGWKEYKYDKKGNVTYIGESLSYEQKFKCVYNGIFLVERIKKDDDNRYEGGESIKKKYVYEFYPEGNIYAKRCFFVYMCEQHTVCSIPKVCFYYDKSGKIIKQILYPAVYGDYAMGWDGYYGDLIPSRDEFSLDLETSM